MSTAELRRKVKRQLDRLDTGGLRSVSDFVSSLKRRGANDEDTEKLAKFRARLAKAGRDIAAGRFTPVDQLKRKY